MGDTEDMQVARKCGSGWAPGSAPSQGFQRCQTCQMATTRLKRIKAGKAPRRPVGAMLIPARAMRRRRHSELLLPRISCMLGLRQTTIRYPVGGDPIGGVGAGGTKRAVRSAWHFYQPSSRVLPAASDVAVSFQRRSVLSGKA
jgi:hypothetical protein